MSVWQRVKPLRARLLVLLAVVGPGIITANVDNDAGGITTYSVAGAHYGYSLLWIMPVVALALIIIQEMSARLGVVTGKGLADLIRESMGVRATAIIIAIMLIANLANTVSEFAGVAASMEIFGVSKYISVPLVAVGVWLLIVKGSYGRVERIFLIASALYLAYVASGIMARPPWGAVLQATVTPTFHFDAGYVTIFVTVIGTTIAPWMQFYQQASIVDKGLKVSDYAYERIDVIVGSVFAVFVACFITVACAATLVCERYPHRDGAGCCPGFASAGRQQRGHAVCAGAVERFGLLGRHLAAVYGIRGLRGLRLGDGGQPQSERGPCLFHHLYVADRAGRGRHPAADQVAGAGHAGQPDAQRRAVARDPAGDAAVDQR